MPKAKARQSRQRKEPVLPEGFLTTTQATRELGVSAATLRRWVKEGKVEAMKVGKQLRFRQSDLRRVVTVPSQSAAPVQEAPTDTEIRRCEKVLDGLLRAQGVRAERAEADIKDKLKGLAKEHVTTGARLATQLLLLGMESRASDIHIEPFEGGARVRLRVDGELADTLSLPKSVNAAVVAELKRWSGMNVPEKLRPQDGRCILNLSGRDIDFRVSVMPAVYGEVMALRILDRATRLPDLTRLGFEANQLERWDRIIHRPNGLILVNGPAGSGKTTVLYATLQKIVNPALNIMTAENPVEYVIPGVSQVAIRPSVGLDYITAVRHMLRQDPDVICVGEIRDRETAEILCTAALTGHLVFSAMHANDAVGSVRRLLDMGVPPHVLASSLQAVTAQRLVRRVCVECKEEHRPAESELLALNIPGDKQQGKFYRGKGCPKCHGSGYRGRVAVIELLELNDKVREGIVRGDDNLRLIEAARASGFRLMTEIVLDKVLRGETSVEDAVRVFVATRT
jgi:excisionase family DNA binding protein